MYRIAVMREGTGIDDDRFGSVRISILNTVDDRALMIGLKNLDPASALFTFFLDQFKQMIVVLVPVYVLLSDTQKIQVRSVDNKQIPHISSSFFVSILHVTS